MPNCTYSQFRQAYLSTFVGQHLEYLNGIFNGPNLLACSRLYLENPTWANSLQSSALAAVDNLYQPG